MPKETKLNPWGLRPGERVEDLDCRIAPVNPGTLALLVTYPDGTGWAEIITMRYEDAAARLQEHAEELGENR